RNSIMRKLRRQIATFQSMWTVAVALLTMLPALHIQASQPLSAVAWGGDAYGECVVHADLTNVVSVATGSGYTVALLSDGTLRDWGSNGYSAPVGLSGVQAVSYRFSLGLALLTNGTVTGWGAPYYGGTNIPAGLSNVISVAAGNYHGLALKNDGTVVGW